MTSPAGKRRCPERPSCGPGCPSFRLAFPPTGSGAIRGRECARACRSRSFRRRCGLRANAASRSVDESTNCIRLPVGPLSAGPGHRFSMWYARLTAESEGSNIKSRLRRVRIGRMYAENRLSRAASPRVVSPFADAGRGTVRRVHVDRCCPDPFCHFGKFCGDLFGQYQNCQTVGDCRGCIGNTCPVISPSLRENWTLASVLIEPPAIDVQRTVIGVRRARRNKKEARISLRFPAIPLSR